MTFVVGVDGGGTRTRAVLLDPLGREIGRGQAPGAVLSSDTIEAVAHAVRLAVEAGIAAAGRALPADLLWAGLAGAGRIEARGRITEMLSASGLAREVRVGTDADAAFHAAFGHGPGILLIAGTGSIALGRDAAGRSLKVGGWGQRLGDEGSGFWLGIQALRAVLRAEDGRAAPTELRTAVLERLGRSEVEELVPWKDVATKAEVAGLAPLVAEVAAGGDETARALVEEAVAELEAHVSAMVRASDDWPDPVPLARWGGLIADGGPLRGPVTGALSGQPVRLVGTEVDAAIGAARLALDAARP